MLRDVRLERFGEGLSFLRSLEGAVGGPDCQIENSAIGNALETIDLDCNLVSGKEYAVLVYVEDDGDNGDGTLGPVVQANVTESAVAITTFCSCKYSSYRKHANFGCEHFGCSAANISGSVSLSIVSES